MLGQGTAWVVGDGLLATNAHVVEGLREAIADGDGTITGLVVSPSAPEHVQHNIINL